MENLIIITLLLILIAIVAMSLISLNCIKSIYNETEKLSLLLTALANKQGCTQDDIDAALGKVAPKKEKK